MKKIHFIGIGGAGTSAAAALAKKSGFEVSGCDTDEGSTYFPELEKLKINLNGNHNVSHLDKVELIVVSAAVDKTDSQNLEIIEAKKRNFEILTTEEFVGAYLAKDKILIAVSGTHGKSTTTAMVGQILEDAGYDPTVYVGTLVNKWGVNFRKGEGKHFVLEADEYEDKFLVYKPNFGIITNVEYDHPDFFKTESQVVESFTNFVKGFKENSKLILGTNPSESENIRGLVGEVGNITSLESSLDKDLGVRLQVPGRHNILNATAAYLCARALGVEEEAVKKSLRKFTGVARRFEFKDEVNNIKIFDDYAHHPSEISATINAVSEIFPNEKVWCVFQPHTFSRTIALFADFVKSFEKADIDKLIFVDIYPAREKDTGKVSSLDLAKKIKGAVYIGDIEEAATYVAKDVSSGDIVINMGAGDIYKLSKILANKLKGQNGRRAS